MKAEMQARYDVARAELTEQAEILSQARDGLCHDLYRLCLENIISLDSAAMKLGLAVYGEDGFVPGQRQTALNGVQSAVTRFT